MGLSALAACSNLRPDPPTVTLAGVALEGATAFEQTVAAKLRVANPNAVNIAIEGYRLELVLGDRVFAAANANDEVVLPARGDALVDVRFRASTVSLLGALARAAQGAVIDPKVRGVVFANAGFGRITVPIDEFG
ncbi:MAG: LEA type 2 family protein, partial [Pseudomonadota bacterium]